MGLARMIRTLTRYNAWADKLMYAAVVNLPEGEATKPRETLFRNMVHTLNHNYVIDRIFQAHLEGQAHDYAARNTADHPPLQDLWLAQQALDDWYIGWSDRITPSELDERIEFTFVGGGQGCMTRAEMVMHVVNHTSYHRGFVADLFFQVPARPPTTDLPIFLRDVKLELD